MRRTLVHFVLPCSHRIHGSSLGILQVLGLNLAGQIIQRRHSRRGSMFRVLGFVFAISSTCRASTGISIEHCFGRQSSVLQNEPNCDKGQQGTLMYHIDDISSYRTRLSSATNPPLLVVCKSTQPLKIRLSLPYIETYTKPGKDGNEFLQLSHHTMPDIKTWTVTGSFLRYTSETNVTHVRWIQFDSLNYLSGIVRCESASMDTMWSQLFIAPSTSPILFQLSSPLNLFIPEISTSNSSIVVPCLGANSSHPGTWKLELHRRSIYNSLYTNEMNQDCISSLCDFTNFTVDADLGPYRDLLGDSPMGDQCREYIKNISGNVNDCNLDAVVSCSDAMFSFPKTRELCELQNEIYQIAVATSHLSVNYRSFQDSGQVQRIDDSVYDESLGFLVPNTSWDYNSEYLCTMNPGNPTEGRRIAQGFIPLDSHKELKATLEIVGDSELTCEINQLPLRHILRKRQTQFWMMDCRSLADCDLQYRPGKGLGQPTLESNRICNNSFVNVDANHAPSIDGKLSLQLPLEFGNAMVSCTGLFITNGTAPFYAHTYRYLFNGLDNRPHFTDEDLPSNSLIRLTAKNEKKRIQVFSCQFSAFYFYSKCIFMVQKGDVRMKFDSNDSKKDYGTISPEELNQGSNTWERNLRIQLDLGEYQVQCSALRLDTGNWERAEISIRVFQASGVGVFVWICFGVLLLFLIVVMAAFLMVINWRAHGTTRRLAPVEIHNFLKGGMRDIDAAADSCPDSVNADKIGFPTELQIKSSSLRIFKSSMLGEGEFGVCVRGQWRNMGVAVKIPKSDADLEYFRAFLQEIKIMGYAGDHPNIVKLYGAVVDDLRNGQCFAVLELCRCRNLLHLLREYSSTSGQVKRLCTNPTRSSLLAVLTSSDMINFSCQIATGMDYLCEKKVIHGDLAARNVLVFADLTLKITDFGLSRKLYKYSVYAKKSATKLPWRWMAFESLKHFKFSLLSDVWSFGVTIWEIYTVGQTPFGGLTWNDDFLRKLEKGYRPLKPSHADEKVYDLMLKCWNKQPAKRPSMSQVKTFFRDSIVENGRQQATDVYRA